jgi:hypothetical protein
MKLFDRKHKKHWNFFSRLAYLNSVVKNPSYFYGSVK